MRAERLWQYRDITQTEIWDYSVYAGHSSRTYAITFLYSTLQMYRSLWKTTGFWFMHMQYCADGFCTYTWYSFVCRKVTSAGWLVTLCDLIWHVISRSGVVISITNCYIPLTYLLYMIFVSAESHNASRSISAYRTRHLFKAATTIFRTFMNMYFST